MFNKLCKAQCGFTLVDLMVAMLIGVMLMIGLVGMIINVIMLTNDIVSRVTLLRDVRFVFDFLGNGGARLDANVQPDVALDFNYIFGLRGRSLSADQGPWWIPTAAEGQQSYMMLRSLDGTRRRYRLMLGVDDGVTANAPTGDRALLSQSIEATTVSCTGIGVPIQDCEVGKVVTGVEGTLVGDPNITTNQDYYWRSIGYQVVFPPSYLATGSGRRPRTLTIWLAFFPIVTAPLESEAGS